MKHKVNVNGRYADDIKPFIKEEMTSHEIGIMGMYIIKEKVRRLKVRIKGVFKHEKPKTDTKKKV